MRKGFILTTLLVFPLSVFAADKDTMEAKVEENADAMFSMCDTNKDGKISKDEYNKEKMDKFAKYDTNKDGVLSKEEHEKMALDTHDKLMGIKS